MTTTERLPPEGGSHVCIAVNVAFSLLAIVSAVLFSRGTWKTKRV